MIQIETFIILSLVLLLSAGCNKGFRAVASVDGGTGLSQSSSTGDFPSLVPGSTTPALGQLGVKDSTCMTNTAYDTCLFWKNPVAERGLAYDLELNIGQDLSLEQIYGIKLQNQLDPNKLESASFRVMATSGVVAKPVNGQWKIPYQKDAGNSYVAQLMAYSWLTFQQQEMERRTGVFYAKNNSILVDAYDSTVTNNAYWDGTQISLGQASFSSRTHEMALSAEVFLHEMGHANIQFAAQTKLFNDPNATYVGSTEVCNSNQGCVTAVNEGQADFHYLLIFGTNTALGETWLNTTVGLESRDVKKITTLSVTDFYNLPKTAGEVHAMGSAYASILYSIYTSPTMNKADFEKMFSLHLQKITTKTRFPEARDILLAEDSAQFNGKYASIIQTAFSSRGVQ